MNLIIQQIHDADLKSRYAQSVLEQLPEWFGNAQSLQEYLATVRLLPFFAALNPADECVGFFSVKIHYQHTGDILPEYQQQGIGSALYQEVEVYFRAHGCAYVMVKTLSETIDYEPYERTRRFYRKQGFVELVTLTEMWDEENPCLIMIKPLG